MPNIATLHKRPSCEAVRPRPFLYGGHGWVVKAYSSRKIIDDGSNIDAARQQRRLARIDLIYNRCVGWEIGKRGNG